MKGQRKQFSAGKRLRFRFETLALRIVAWLVPKFPRRLVHGVGRALGWLTYYVAPGLRDISRQNLDVAFGDTKTATEKRGIARQSLQNVGATMLSLFWTPRLTKTGYDKLVDVDPDMVRRVRELHARGKGLICVTAHFGDWELLGLSVGYYAIPMTVVQEIMRNEAIEAIFARLRGVSGNRLVPNRFAATTLLKTLKRGGGIALLIDQNATSKRGGVWLDFFGLPAYSSGAAGALAVHTGAPIIAGFSYPGPEGRMRIIWGPEMTIERTDSEEADMRTLNQKCLRYCEDVIRAHPEHWLWSYKRWKFRPTEDWGKYPRYSRYWPAAVKDAEQRRSN
ncbi:MAG TPA: hypothetical protein VLZ12_04955 [Verrucomicrobiae bacterium]|nr:hypothetical protein [Verrucomicrobiae bacterium]